jgi:hypothetical protein
VVEKKKRPKSRPKPVPHPSTGGVSVFTAARVGQFLAHVREGLWRETAAPMAGIGDRTLRRWVAKGREEIERADKLASTQRTEKIPTLGRFGSFVVELLAAEAAAEAQALGIVLEIQRGRGPDIEHPDGTITPGPLLDPAASLKAATWWLERRNNLRYGRGSQRTDLMRGTAGGSDDEGLETEDVGAFVLGALQRALDVQRRADERAASAAD